MGRVENEIEPILFIFSNLRITKVAAPHIQKTEGNRGKMMKNIFHT
jgi:hypothetical protein